MLTKNMRANIEESPKLEEERLWLFEISTTTAVAFKTIVNKKVFLARF